MSDLTTWPQVHAPVRVIRSQATYRMKRPATQASTEPAVRFGHRRWDIEKYEFNQLVSEWHSDHVYKRHAQAMESFLLLAFLAYNLFHAFRLLHLKPQIHQH